MHRALGYISKRLFHVRAGEGRKVLLTFLYFCLVITAYYVIKPVSRSLALGDLGSHLIPLGDLISAILMGPMVALFARLVDRVEKRRLVSWTFWSAAGSLLVFWQLLGFDNKWVAAAFYVWVSMFSVLVVTLFWLVANDLYHPREAKRLFGFIGSGGILGGVIGSSIAAAGAKLIGTEQLLVLSAAILIGCWAVVRMLWPYALGIIKGDHPSQGPRASAFSNLAGFAKLLSESRYLLLLVGLVGIAKIVATLVYYQLNPFVERMFPTADARTAFFGLYLGWVNVASFVVQFFLTSWVLRRLGLMCALLVLPLGLLGGSIGLLLVPSFWLAAVTELYDGSMNYSLQQTTKEVLYLPIDRSIRYKIKPFIDMVVFRFGKGFAALIGLLVLTVFHQQARVLCYLTIPLILAWLAIAIQLRFDYVTTIRSILRSRVAARRARHAAPEIQPPLFGAPRAAAGSLNGDAALDGHAALEAWLEAVTAPHPLQEKLTLASQLFACDGDGLNRDGEHLLAALEHYDDWADASASEGWPVTREQLKSCLSDPHEPLAKRRYAVRQLVQDDGQEIVDCLLGMLMVEEDAAIRHELIRGLALLRMRHPHGLEFPRRMIRRQIAKEVAVYDRILHIASAYGRALTEAPRERDAAIQLLRLLLEESSSQIFRLLSLLYRPEDIYLIDHQIHQPDTYVRADAVELLDNLIDPGLRGLIFPVLDENHFLDRLETGGEESPEDWKRVCQLFRESIWDHRGWLSVVTLCLAGRLNLDPLLDEVDQAPERQTPLVALAVRVARQLAEASHA